MSEQALSGVRVLDLTWYVAGPYCTKLLADYGADVIKVERPGAGDPARRMGPFLDEQPHPEKSGLFLYLNNNKKSITLNLRSMAGKKLFKELAREANILVESFSPGVMSRLGLDYETLEGLNRGLVMTSISSFGQTGPYRDYKAAHIVEWAMAGWRFTDGLRGTKPVQPGGWLTHYIAGLYAAVGTMGALHLRDETGTGQHLDISEMEACLLVPPYHVTWYAYSGQRHQSQGAAYLGILPCKDGYVGVNCFTQPHWEALWSFVGMPEVLQDPRFKTRYGAIYGGHIGEAIAMLVPWLKEHTKEEIFHSGQDWRIPTGLVPTTKEMLEIPHLQGRGFFVEVDHPEIGRVTQPGAPFKMIATPWQVARAAPLLGEHNPEVYSSLGYSREDLSKLREAGVI